MDLDAISKMYASQRARPGGRANIRSFPEDLYLHLIYGYAIVTPTSILLGRPIYHLAPYAHIIDPSHVFTNPDCWFVWLAVGATPMEFISATPYPLPYVAWERHNHFRFYEFAKLQARISF
jgi:hypothetical protein